MLTLTAAVVDGLALAGADAELAKELAADAYARRVAARIVDREKRLGSCVVCRGMGRGYVVAVGRTAHGGRCAEHLPPQPSTGYCAPRRCYCAATSPACAERASTDG